jgi:glycosyltransferase involved in cell wall biosynthesis
MVRTVLPSAHVRLVGPRGDDAGYVSELEQLRLLTGAPDSVEFVGPRRGQALRAEYAAAAVIAQPSRQDNAPMAIAEAMAVGRPVVAARVGGIPDLVTDGVTGVLCGPENPQQLSRALVRVLGHDGLREQFGSAAAADARRRFDPAVVAAAHMPIYERLANRPYLPHGRASQR